MDINKQPIIDFHTHPYLDLEGDLCMYSKDFYLTTEQALDDIKMAGINHICGSVIKRESITAETGFEPIRKVNREALKIKELYGDFYTPGFHIHPGFLKESLEEIEFMYQKGVKLVGELVPYIQGWSEMGYNYASKELWEILRLAGEYGMIVSYHTILDQQDEMNAMIENNPDVTFVMAHPGQRAEYEMQLERLRKYPNTYLDLSGSGLFRYGMLAKGVNELGSKRFIFGTDYPISNAGMYVQALLYEHITDEQRADIYYNNAKELLGL